MPFDFTQLLIFILIGLLFFKENVLSWIAQKLGIKSGTGSNISGLSRQIAGLDKNQTELREYYNHETTEKLQALEKALDSLHIKFDEHIRLVDKTNYILEDIRSNGIKCRM